MREFKLLVVSFLLLSITAFPTLGTTTEATGKQLLWKVSSADGTAYLLGSIHFGTESMYPLPAVITDAFDRSDALAVEINMLNIDPVSAAAVFLDKGIYKDGKNLQSQVGTETWQALDKAASRYGLMLDLLQLQKPWVVALSLSAAEFRRAGYSESLGVDQYFLQQAKDSKPILELESLSQQIGIFESFSQAEQEEFLLQTLQELDKGVDYLTALIAAWSQGDASKISALITGSFALNPVSQRIYQRLFTDRNIAMTAKIEDLLKTGKSYFVVVGAGHLVSEEGIVQQLAERGYSVEQL